MGYIPTHLYILPLILLNFKLDSFQSEVLHLENLIRTQIYPFLSSRDCQRPMSGNQINQFKDPFPKSNNHTRLLSSDNRSQCGLQIPHRTSDFGQKLYIQRWEQQTLLSEEDNDIESAKNTEFLIDMAIEPLDPAKQLNLSSRKISPQNPSILLEALSSFQGLQWLNLSFNQLGDKGIAILSSNKSKSLTHLQQLDLTENQLGTRGARFLGVNTIWKKLTLLNLSGNLVCDDGIKFIAQNSAWTDLQVLCLNLIGITHNGARALAANESWKNLQELHLDGNIGLGDQGLLALASNRTWINLQRLVICDSGVRAEGLNFLRRNRNLKNLKVFASKSSRKNQNEKYTEANSFNSAFLMQRNIAIRGGAGGKTDTGASNTQELSSKISQFKERVKSNKDLESDLSFYIETRAVDNLLEDIDGKNVHSFELDFKIKKYYLDSNNAAKVLLITGKTGIGKSLFCRYLQRSILMDWIHEDQHETGDREWLPIYLDLLTLKNFNSSAVNEALMQELQLTESELKLLQTSVSSSTLPQILFILDGYDAIQDTGKLKGYHDFIQNNFYTKNGFEKAWPNAKIIVTCREESLSDISQRDLVFAPLDQKRGVSIAGSYMEYTIQPFTDIEITTYMRKYVIARFPNAKEENDADISSHYPDSLRNGAVSSWGLVKAYEEIVDRQKSKQVLRIPLTLSMAVDILNDIAEKGYDSIPYLKESILGVKITSGTRFDRWFYYEAFTNRLIISTAANVAPEYVQAGPSEKENHLKLLEKFQDYALSVCHYKRRPKEIDPKVDNVFTSSTLVSKDGQGAYQFVHRSVQEFFIAQAIVHELSHLHSDFSSPENIQGYILNQKLQEHTSQVIRFLKDAYQGARLNPKALRELVYMSRSIPVDQRLNEEEKNGISSKRLTLGPQIGNAAANAITILNLGKFNFREFDFRGVNIPGAYLSHGKFDNTNFSGANLTGVVFRNACLKNTDFTLANLSEVEFGVMPDLKFNKHIACMEFSQNGQKLAVALGKQISVFEKDPKGLFFREVRVILGHENNVESLTFSTDGKKIISSGIDKMVYVWDAITGDCLQELAGRKSSQKQIRISPDDSKIASVSSDQSINVWDASTYEHMLQIKGTSKNRLVCEFSPNGKLLLHLDEKNHTLRLRNSTTGLYYRKYYFEEAKVHGLFSFGAANIDNFKFLGGGRQIVTRSSNQMGFYTDTIRCQVIKCFETADKGECFHPDEKQSIAIKGNDIVVQDTATGQLKTILKRNERWQRNDSNRYYFSFVMPKNVYCPSPEKKLLADVVDSMTRIAFLDISSLSSWKNGSVGEDQNGKLELLGAKIDSASGLSKETLPLFMQYGEYSEFDEETIQNLILGSAENVKEIILPGNGMTSKGATIIGRNTTWVNLEKLDLHYNKFEDFGAVEIAKNTAWTHLKKLNLSENKIGNEGAIALAANNAWTELEELSLAWNGITDEGVQGIGKNTSWKNLTSLILSRNGFGPEAVKSLATNPTWVKLEGLYLSFAKFGDQGATNLSANTTWTNLKILDVSDCNLTSCGVAELAKNTTWNNLEVLNLNGNGIRDPGATELSKNTTWEKLRELRLQKTWITSKGIADLAKNTVWKNLQILKLDDNSLKVDGFKALCANTSWRDMQKLSINTTQMGDKGFDQLAKNTTWSKLIKLDAEKCELTFSAMNYAAKSACWAKLEKLNLSQNSLSDKGATSIIKNKQWVNLKKLILRGNRISAEGINSLASKNPWPNLEELDLSANNINAEAARALSGNTNWTKLRVLILSFNSISDAGAISLGANKSWVNLQRLELTNTGFASKGVEGLAKNVSWKNLQKLVLSRNRLGDQGAKALGSNVSWINLKELDLESTEIGDVGAIDLCDNVSWVNLGEIIMQGNKAAEEGLAALSNNEAWPKLKNIVTDRRRNDFLKQIAMKK